MSNERKVWGNEEEKSLGKWREGIRRFSVFTPTLNVKRLGND